MGAIGEGEEDRPAHPRRDELVRLLLERGAEPYDIQVFYNIHFHGDVHWFLELIHERSLKLGRRADWDDPEWRMIDMGGYGMGARYLLDIAIGGNDLELAEWLLSHGASATASPPRHPRLSKRTLCEEAVRRGYREMADLLVRYGATRGSATVDGETAFTAACFRLDREQVRSIIAEHAEYLHSAKTIIAAAERDRIDVVELLLELGVSIEIENAQKQRPLHAAAWHDAVHVAQFLIDRGAEIDPVETNWNNTPLDFAVYGQHQRMIELLGRYSRDIGNLVYSGNVERVRELLRDEPSRARVVWKGNHTPLMWLPDDEAAAVAMVELFLTHGADPAIRGGDGLTAADHASRRGLEEAAAWLRAHERSDR